MLLGYYENFPETIHGIARFTYKASQRKIQKAIVSAFHKLNKERRQHEEVAHYPSPNCVVDFELGVGEDNVFTFLDGNELSILEAEINKKTLVFLDFLCILQYHVADNLGRPTPLRFDYYMLRFGFERNNMEFLVSHERGPQHVHVEDLIGFLIKYFKKELVDHYSIHIKLEDTSTV